MAKLNIQHGSQTGREFSFDETVLIGRGSKADLSLDDPTISRRHAEISRVGPDWYVSDLGSGNGTFVNDRRISEPTLLRDGTELTFGTVVAEFQHDQRVARPADQGTSVRLVDTSVDESEVLDTMGPGEHDAEHDEAAASAVSRRLRFLSDFSKVIGETLDEETLMAFALDEIFELMPQAERAFVMLQDEDDDELVTRKARTRSDGTEEIAVSRTLLDDVTERREGVLLVQSDSGGRYARSESLHALGIRSAICVPILCHEDFHGIIQVDCTYVDEPFERADMALLMGIAAQFGMFLAYSRLHAKQLERRLMERDLTLARRIQTQFLPGGVPDHSGYDFAVEYNPALAVGGDYYGFFELDDGRLLVAVADASGKGISAALYVARFSSDLRYQTASSTDPREILARVNDSLSDQGDSGMFATMALLTLSRDGEVSVCNAGHPLPLLRTSSGEVEPLGHSGDPPLGLRTGATFDERTYAMEPGENVVLYTDGISEAENRDRELFGEERLRAAVGAADGAEGTLDTVLDAVHDFSRGARQSDDITLVCVERV